MAVILIRKVDFKARMRKTRDNISKLVYSTIMSGLCGVLNTVKIASYQCSLNVVTLHALRG